MFQIYLIENTAPSGLSRFNLAAVEQRGADGVGAGAISEAKAGNRKNRIRAACRRVRLTSTTLFN